MKIIIRLIVTVFIIIALLLVLAWPAGSGDGGQESSREGLPFPRQKALFEKLRVMEAWAMTKGSPEVKIGVIETGFDFYHPGLKDNLNPGYYAPGGYHLDISDSVAHGTMVTSIIVAHPFPGGEMSGLAPDCQIMAACLGLVEQPLLRLKKRFDEEHPGADLAEFQKEMAEHIDELKSGGENWANHMALSTAGAIRHLVDAGARVVNISALFRKSLIPSPEAWEKLDAAFRAAASKDVLIVLGAGNNGLDCDDYPGDGESTVVVGAATMDDKPWEQEMSVGGQKFKQGSNFGRRLTVMAPSVGLMVCAPHEPRFYACDDGPTGAVRETFEAAVQWIPVGATSCATPIVTSLAALVLSLRPDLPASAVLDIIRRGCDDIGEAGTDLRTGHGRVNFGKTLTLAKSWKE
jgi:thermitase